MGVGRAVVKPLVWLDLCSGLGGASQPALDRGWKVIRVDIDPRFKPDIVADVRHLPLKPFHVDVLWASPVCTDFAKWGMRCFFPEPPDPDLSLVLGVRQAIDRFNPRFWAVENVRSSRPWLNRIFGIPRACSVSHVLYGTFPGLIPPIRAHKSGDRSVAPNGGRQSPRMIQRWGKGDEHAAAEAAKIPYEIGEAICAAVERRAAE